MPDAHPGYSLPIGAVVATENTERVIRDQADLIEVVHRVRPIVNVKG